MANLKWFPINPLLKEDGSFYSLSLMDNADELKPLYLEDDENPFSLFSVTQSSLNVQTAADLGISFGSANVSYKSFCLSYEAMLFTEKITTNPIGGKIYGTRWGAGLRVVLKVTDIESNASFNFGAIAAAAELGLAKVEYEIRGIGISSPSILKILPGPGEFNFANYNKILEAADKVKDYMSKNEDKLKPQPFQVFMSDELGRDIFKDSQSVIFAARNVMTRNSLSEALASAGAKFSPEIIMGFYAKVGILDDKTTPTRDDKKEAQSFLDV
ncbi:hypothetical protein ESY86_15820 [Subsaximicrobium wynnwilliamsii]|uniref:Uncharacterized protein n=1 Tax=Subsaximicrobium wynnwilliamsii TaxID=291179 RepID=A0A5C6ZF14_9FLAO|nr:hypothetical protein [Subsaximicrobium wynnwilliamsii]TXD82133.1 hypothetical protein ESY87_15410 [Subsaximicrobium wynnwilliamsii]TXD87778.1 hypothetical protein ESY86_15820 [Subsaximicrobium wynnwilliamsii]TXE01589.1 hypothetical protein ESY88_15400 [Subsaximicrobium wynnwilliamsii]